MMSRVLKKYRSDERGAVLILMAALVASMVAVLALVIDLSRQQIVAKQVQSVVDSAVVAGAQELNGRQDGWLAAKRFALKVLQESEVAEVGRIFSGGIALSEGTVDPFETEAAFRGTATPAGQKISISVERGAYWADPDSGAMQFVPFEGERTKYGLNSFLIANAVRVRLTYTGLRTYFGGMLGMTVFDDLTREAIAVKDSPEECVSAIALPACSMLLDTNPYLARRYYTDELRPSDQCFREVLVTEANNDTASRREGITRYQSFNPQPLIEIEQLIEKAGTTARSGIPGYTAAVRSTICPYSRELPGGRVQNCKAFRADGVLGVPGVGADSEGRGATSSEVHNVFRMPNSCTKVKLGQRFKPLEATTFLNDGNFERTLADTINGGIPWRDAFVADGRAKANYPYVRRYRPDLNNPPPAPQGDAFVEQRIHYPRKVDGQEIVSNMIMGPQGGINGKDSASVNLGPSWWYNFTNPLCHSSRLPYNDPFISRAREVNVMLLAPSEPGTNYCDFRAVFEQEEQQSEAPIARTAPIVVGFMKGYLFDYNISSLREPISYTPSAASRDNGVTYDLKDQNPLGMQLQMIIGSQKMAEFKGYMVSHSEWFEAVRDCQRDASCPPAPSGGGGSGSGDSSGGGRSGSGPACSIWALKQQCWSSVPRPAPPPPPPANSLSECFNVPDFAGLWAQLRAACNSTYTDTNACAAATTSVNNELNRPYQNAKPGKHCIPMLKRGQPPNKSDSWEVKDLGAQYGCGGLRMRLSCESNLSLPGLEPWTRSRASLVN